MTTTFAWSRTLRAGSSRARVADALTSAIVDGRISQELRPADRPALIEAADVHRVAGYVHHALRRQGQVDEGLAELSTRSALRHLQAIADLARLGSLLDEAGIRWCTMKGPVAAELLHGAADLRRYDDLDVLVAPDDLAAVVDLVEQAGAEVLDAHWLTLVAWRHAQIHLRLWSHTTLDLHWNLLNEPQDREVFSVSTGSLLDRRRRVDVGGVQAWTLDPADTLLHLCLHAVVGGGQRLSWLRDIQLAANAPGLDWDEVERRARQVGAALATAVMLRQSAAALGDAGLAASARRLSPSRTWLAATAVGAAISPPAQWRGRDHVTLGTVLLTSTRASAGCSAAEAARSLPRLVRRLMTSTRSRAALRVVRDAARQRLLGPPPAVLQPGDGPHARGLYLRWVRESARSPAAAPQERSGP